MVRSTAREIAVHLSYELSFTDLTVEQPSLSTGAQAVLAVKTRQVILGNVSVQGGDGQLPLVKTKTDGYYQYTQ